MDVTFKWVKHLFNWKVSINSVKNKIIYKNFSNTFIIKLKFNYFLIKKDIIFIIIIYINC